LNKTTIRLYTTDCHCI